MSEKQPSQFTPIKVEGTPRGKPDQLYVPDYLVDNDGNYISDPSTVVDPYNGDPKKQEAGYQKEIIGTDGNGSIRAETPEQILQDEQDELREVTSDIFVKETLDPENILGLQDSISKREAYLKSLGNTGKKLRSQMASLATSYLKIYVEEQLARSASPADRSDDLKKFVLGKVKVLLDMPREDLLKLIKGEATGETHLVGAEPGVSTAKVGVETSTEADTAEEPPVTSEPRTSGADRRSSLSDSTELKSKEWEEMTRLEADLEAKRAIYANLLAERRGKSISIRFSAKKLKLAKEDWELTMDRAGAQAALLIRRSMYGMDPKLIDETVAQLSLDAAQKEVVTLSEATREKRQEIDTYYNIPAIFVNWWARKSRQFYRTIGRDDLADQVEGYDLSNRETWAREDRLRAAKNVRENHRRKRGGDVGWKETSYLGSTDISKAFSEYTKEVVKQNRRRAVGRMLGTMVIASFLG